ncbi:E3 ubiquitin-protein ligase TRIP12 [Sporothrix schenckii 1099-18]|uniref:HECT-type E3 ubiquitin transferase n=1 Tax=Sporothrix schenckii 1099-18 TaxID=1397361 RepID=A0A0F2LWH5_SPOSC|nr:E3 ubiquitin-protein ligase TRIP12 [Sporothrix schenckii 1099-18]KJR81184.1 E3 ubiquitin-protein ligase TRIP12 [Sporothrix schenckii 1099-18]
MAEIQPSNSHFHPTRLTGEADESDVAMSGADDPSIDAAHTPYSQTEIDEDRDRDINEGEDRENTGQDISEGDNDDIDDDDEDHGDDEAHRYSDGELDESFQTRFATPHRGSGLPVALSMLGGMLSMSGISGRLREILNNLRREADPSVQLIALQDLSEILLVSNEDNLIGNFSPDPYVRDLVALMQPNEITGEENPEMMLLACRCLANLMEAIPASAANVVYGGAVPVLCQKLLEISFIDVAEQALSTLEKISVEYPSQIVREGGLTACLSYLEFFATSTQRTAVTTAANCCRNIPEDSFPEVRDVMPILLNVLYSNDQRVVEQAALCVSRIVECFKQYPPKLEELVGVDLLKAILRLLLPSSTNHFIGPSLHTQFLRVLAITADDSPLLAAELFKMNVVETLYQSLTGVSPPAGVDDIAAKLDSVLVMQALIHRPKEQIIETLNVVCNLLPKESAAVPVDSVIASMRSGHTQTQSSLGTNEVNFSSSIPESNRLRLRFLRDCQAEVRRFTLILLPTLIDAYSSTVNLEIRMRVLAAQIRILSNFDKVIILEALEAVPFASFLASILSQQDHTSLVSYALQATELLLSRLGDIYRYQLYREGVISEIEKIAGLPANGDHELSLLAHGYPALDAIHSTVHNTGHQSPTGIYNHKQGDNVDLISNPDHEERTYQGRNYAYDSDNFNGLSSYTGLELEDEDSNEDIDEAVVGQVLSQHYANVDGADVDRVDDEMGDEEEELRNSEEGMDAQPRGRGSRDGGHDDEVEGSSASSGNSMVSDEAPARQRRLENTPSQAQIRDFARDFLARHEIERNEDSMRTKATQTLTSLSSLADDISTLYLERKSAVSADEGCKLFTRLATYFDSNVFDSATSAELLGSGLVNVLDKVFGNRDEHLANAAQAAFLDCFTSRPVRSRTRTHVTEMPITPFSILVHKLQDLLSRSEHFEVITVHDNAFDGNHTSAASMLAKQIRLRLVADDDAGVPRAFRSIMVSIHAIATFKILEDYLRPRISLTDRSRFLRRDGLSRALAAMADASVEHTETALAARLVKRDSNLGSKTPIMPEVLTDGSETQESSTLHVSRHAQNDHQTSPMTRSQSQRDVGKTKSSTRPNSNPLSVPSGVGFDAESKPGLRRSSRHHTNSSNFREPVHPQIEGNALAKALECNGERRISEHGELDLPVTNAMETIDSGLDEDMKSSDDRSSSAVNLEFETGGKITRQAVGTRLLKPSQGSAKDASTSSSVLTTALHGMSPEPAKSSTLPSSSHKSALQSTSQDWHFEFSLDGRTVSSDSTVYRAVLNSTAVSDEQPSRSVWSTIHTVRYRRIPGPQSQEPSAFGFPGVDNRSFGSSLSESTGSAAQDGFGNSVSVGALKNVAITTSILRLLKNLHDLNANIDDILVSSKEPSKPNAEPLLQFVNTKLTAKLNRQLEEPLIVASNCLPNWSEDLARMYPFLFPFETRHLFLQSTSFGYARSMARWQNAQVQDESRGVRRDDRPFLGRLQRQKVRISRSKILESAVKVMELYGTSQSILEVEYFEEVGTGLGPTLEFYSTVSREFSKKKLRLWRDNDLGDSEFVSGPNGLFPRPISAEDAEGTNGERLMSLFKALGRFVARSMLDSRIIDINFNPIFFRIGNESQGMRPSLGAVKVVDPTLARSLLLIKKFANAKKVIEEGVDLSATEKAAGIQAITIDDTSIDDLSLDFTLPGYPDIELIPGGCHISVTMSNVDTYVDKVVAMTLEGGVRLQVDAFRKGFSEVFPYSALSAFTPDELVSLFGHVDEDWSLETLSDSIKADHGFNMDSRNVKNLLQVMSEMSLVERREFLQFATGSPRLPIGGFRSLTPMFTVVCKPSEAPYSSDDYLPSVMTCVNYLKLPDYTSIDVLRKQLFTAIKEGQGAFHLS